VRFIRLSSTNPTVAPVVKYGLQEEADMKKAEVETGGEEDKMEVDGT